MGRTRTEALKPNTPGLPADWEIRLMKDGTLDEVVGTGVFHLEKMDRDRWWMALYHPGDPKNTRININLWRNGNDIDGVAILERSDDAL